MAFKIGLIWLHFPFDFVVKYDLYIFLTYFVRFTTVEYVIM